MLGFRVLGVERRPRDAPGSAPAVGFFAGGPSSRLALNPHMRNSLGSSKGDYLRDHTGNYHSGYLGGYLEFRLELTWSRVSGLVI